MDAEGELKMPGFMVAVSKENDGNNFFFFCFLSNKM